MFHLRHSLQTAAAVILIGSFVHAQTDSVDVTFFYKPSGNPSVVFLPGEFNDWGPNSNGTISSNAPSRMTFDAVSERWAKTVRLRVGGPASGGGVSGAYQYKLNENGTSGGWLSDPLNPRQNPADNNNSFLYVKNPTAHYLVPNSVSGLVTGQRPEITAYLYPATNSSVDTSSLRLVIDNTTYTGIGSSYDANTNLFSFTTPSDLSNGSHSLKLYVRSSTGSQSGDSTTFSLVTNPPLVIQALPAGMVDGINYVDANTATMALYAPRKDFVYLIGSFNDWQIDTDYFMKLTPDSSRFWITLTGLQPNQQYLFQYLVNGSKRIADPYADQVSDPFNDSFISSNTYPNLISYPSGKTQEIASLLQTSQTSYTWEATEYERREAKDLVIYELLIRDFIAAHDYKTLIDTLAYLQNLGINAIELMPVNEFEGNESWGYNPSFYFAPDKYYGPRNDLKRFIDECHQRGIAVIIDMVLNHSFGQSPFVRLYSQGNYGPPTPDNPWYNVTATHPFSVGYDFNHESLQTKTLVDRVNAFWLTEYQVDGFRFDLSKGFTQRQSGSDVGFWSGYDASRIAILKRMADQIWEVDSTAYVILEHFADNTEEKELAEYNRGMMLWGNLNTAYSQSAMGWLEDSGRSSDLAWGYYKTRGWSKPGLVTYMESHDEEWLMYKNLQFGRSSGSYNVQNLATALDRIKLVAAFFLTLPGPKMIWQFGELGYDQHLPESGGERTANKPILWQYFTQPERKGVYKVFSALLKLRNEHEVFRSTETQVSMRVGQGQYDRRLNLNHPSMNVTIIGNFDVNQRNVTPNFQTTGTWYDYLLSDSITVTDTQAAIALAPGEFHVYTSKLVDVETEVDEPLAGPIAAFKLEQNYPNPFNPSTRIHFDLPKSSRVRVSIFDVSGRHVALVHEGVLPAGSHSFLWNGASGTQELVRSGVYFLRVEAGEEVRVRKMMLVR